MKKEKILGVSITNATMDEILEYIVDFVKKGTKKGYIVTPNPEILTFSTHHDDFRDILNNAEIALSDGVGVTWAGQLLAKPLKERVSGVDLTYKLCERIADQPITVGFLGAGPKIAEITADCLKKHNIGLKVVFASEEWPKDPRSQPQDIDILFIAFGFPKQEEWMSQNLSKIPVKIMIGVGGTFDYISGSVPRAPLLVRSLGMEWLFRLIIQPWRMRRQLALIEFIWLVLKEKLDG